MEHDFSIKTATQLTGLNEHTLRAWERRYGAVVPQRTPSGRRVYSRDDVARLGVLVQLVERGHKIKALGGLTDQRLGLLLAATLELEDAPGRGTARVSDDAQHCLEAVLVALRHYDLGKVHQTLLDARYRIAAKAFALTVVAPLMAAVGRLVVTGELSIAQEHALSAIIKAHLTVLTFGIQAPSYDQAGARHVALATIEGDLHEIGLLVAAVVCAHHGWRVHYIGPNMPPKPLGDALTAIGTSLVIVGVTALPPGLTRWDAGSYAEALGRALPRNHAIWIGGHSAAALKKPKIKQPWRHVPALGDLDALLA